MIRRNFLKTAAALAASFPRPSAAGAASYRAEMPDMLYLARRLNALSAKWTRNGRTSAHRPRSRSGTGMCVGNSSKCWEGFQSGHGSIPWL